MTDLADRCPHCGALSDGAVTRRCIDCSSIFRIPIGAQRFFISKGLEFPRRCEACRSARRQLNANQRAVGAQKE
jgi:hypothetical protein